MKILITGSTGLLGSRINQYFRTKKYLVFSTSYKKSKKLKCNLKNFYEFKKLYDKIQPNFIINLACLSNVDLCEYNFKEAIKLNSIIPKNIVKVVKNDPVKIIHISTDHVYNSIGKNHEDNVSLTNNYSFSKFLGEKYIVQNKNSIVLRTNFFGKSISDKESFSDWIFNNCKKKDIKIFDDVFFNPISMTTLCKIINKVMKTNKNGIYNLGSDKVLSKFEFSKLLLKLNGINNKLNNISIEKVNLFSKRPHYMGMNVDKFIKTFNYKKIKIEREILKEL